MRRAAHRASPIVTTVAAAMGVLCCAVWGGLSVGCGYGPEDYCSDRAWAECRQLFAGGCFSVEERVALARSENPFVAEGMGGEKAECTKGVKEACLARVTNVAQVYAADRARECVQLIQGVDCADYKTVWLRQATVFAECRDDGDTGGDETGDDTDGETGLAF